MNLNEIVKIIEERNSNNYSNFYKIYDEYKSTNPEYVNLLLELLFSNEIMFIDNFYIVLAEGLKEYGLKSARFFYLYDIIKKEKTSKYRIYNIYGESGIYFDCEWKTLLKQEMYEDLVGAYYFKNKKKERMINRLINKSKKIDNPKKIEKILKKAASTDDCYPIHELGMFYYQNNNKEEAIRYLSQSGDRHYYDSAAFLANLYMEEGNHELEIKYLLYSLRKDNPSDYSNIISKLKKYNMSLKPIYKTLEWNVYRSDELCYLLATMYENGEYVEKDELCAYALYLCSNGYSDAVIHMENIAQNLLSVYKLNSDTILDKFIQEYKNERKAKEEEKEKKAKEKADLIALYPDRKIELNPDYKSYVMLFDKKGQLANREKYYKKALLEKRAYKIIPLLEKAAEEGHHRALLALYDYYKDSDYKKAYDYALICRNTYTGNDLEFKEELKQKFESIEKIMKEESDRLWKERQEELRKKREEEEKLANEERILMEKKLQEELINNPLLLDKDPNYEDIFEDDINYKKAIEAYKKALSTNDVSKIVDNLREAAKFNHPKAIKKLIEYYYDNNIDEARKWLIIGLRNNVDLDDEVSNWKEIDLDLALKLAFNGYREGIKYLENVNNLELSDIQIYQIEDAADQYNGAFEFLYNYMLPINKEKAIEYAINAAYLGNEKLVFELIGERIHEKTSPKLVRYLLDTKDTKVSDQKNWLLIDIYQIEHLAKIFGIPFYGSNYTFKHLMKMKNATDLTIKEKVWRKIAYYYESGIGIEKDLYKAAEYYKPYDKIAATNCINKYKYETVGIHEVLKKADILMKKYPCPELDRLLSMDVTQAKLIVEKYGSFPSSIVEKDMIHRDYMLKKGYKIKELYSNTGIYIGDEIDSRQMKQNVPKNNENVETPIINPIITHENNFVDLKVNDNNVKFVMFGKLNADPNNPERDNHAANIYFPANFYTDMYRKNRKESIKMYGAMETFYCESLFIDGVLINTHPFSNHLNLTLQAGYHSVKATFVIELNFSGSLHSTSVYNRTLSSDYLYNCAAKNKTFRYKKTFAIDNFIITPGQDLYLTFFANIYGVWKRLYDANTGEYVGKERMNVISDFAFVSKIESQIRENKNYRHLSDSDFINIDDIGKLKYHPLYDLSQSEEKV